MYLFIHSYLCTHTHTHTHTHTTYTASDDHLRADERKHYYSARAGTCMGPGDNSTFKSTIVNSQFGLMDSTEEAASREGKKLLSPDNQRPPRRIGRKMVSSDMIHAASTSLSGPTWCQQQKPHLAPTPRPLAPWATDD